MPAQTVITKSTVVSAVAHTALRMKSVSVLSDTIRQLEASKDES
jgi:hypothetical protein